MPETDGKRRGWRLTLGEVIALLIVLGILVGLLMPAFFKVRQGAKRPSCKNNLRQIGIALHLYADDYGDAFPTVDTVPRLFNVAPGHTVQALGRLYSLKYTDNPKIFSCPSTPSPCGDFRCGGTLKDTSTSYAYDSRHSSGDAGPVILAGDCQDGAKPVSANHYGDGGNYLAIDGSVQWVRKPNDPNATKLCIDATIDDDIWSLGPPGYVHDSCLRRTVK